MRLGIGLSLLSVFALLSPQSLSVPDLREEPTHSRVFATRYVERSRAPNSLGTTQNVHSVLVSTNREPSATTNA
jgi:hypothetical protein